MNKNLKNIIIIFSLFFGCSDCLGMLVPPWNVNTREHLFGTADNASIEDEGFRWKDSFNFTIDAPGLQPAAGGGVLHQIPAANWQFNRIIQWNVDPANFTANNAWNNGINANQIHQHLSQIIRGVEQQNHNQNSITVAAVTIVVDVRQNVANPPVYRAYSKVISNAGNNRSYAAVNMNGVHPFQDPNNVFTSIALGAQQIRQNLNYINGNIPNIETYSCTEGKFLAQLLIGDGGGSGALLRSEINVLLHQANVVQAAAAVILPFNEINPIPANRIKLIILHIGTKMDPCAVCTRNLVGLSRDINYIPPLLPGQNRANLGLGVNAKFLIEVSSNGHYQTQRQGNNFHRDVLGSNYGSCSHTECAGHDENHTNLANITINNAPIDIPPIKLPVLLAVPGGKENILNWVFEEAFPPYIIFGRINQVNGNVYAPVFNINPVAQNVCGTINPGAVQSHTGQAGNATHPIRNNLATIN